MPFDTSFAVIQVSRDARRKLKSLAAQMDKPMYQVFDELVTQATSTKPLSHSHSHITEQERELAIQETETLYSHSAIAEQGDVHA